jgi:hypothetical protein
MDELVRTAKENEPYSYRGEDYYQAARNDILNKFRKLEEERDMWKSKYITKLQEWKQ